MVRFFTLVAGLCVLSGCTMFESAPGTAATDVLPQVAPERAAEMQPGTKVEIERRFASAQTRATTTGVVLKASADGLALANCTVQGTSIHGSPIVSKLPYTGRLFKNTGVGTEQLPVLWVPLNEISAVKVLEPAPAEYVAPEITIESANTTPKGVDFDVSPTDNTAAKIEIRSDSKTEIRAEVETPANKDGTAGLEPRDTEKSAATSPAP